jgi:hypothetical protein
MQAICKNPQLHACSQAISLGDGMPDQQRLDMASGSKLSDGWSWWPLQLVEAVFVSAKLSSQTNFSL